MVWRAQSTVSNDSGEQEKTQQLKWNSTHLGRFRGIHATKCEFFMFWGPENATFWKGVSKCTFMKTMGTFAFKNGNLFYLCFSHIDNNLLKMIPIHTNPQKNDLKSCIMHARQVGVSQTKDFQSNRNLRILLRLDWCGIDSTRCWKHSSEILVHIVMIASHSCCRFVVCTSMMRISRSSTSQRCSIGLRSGDCGGYLSKVNSLSCSRNQSEMIWSLWRCIILLEVHQKMVHCSHKEMDTVSNNTQVDWCLNDAQLVLMDPKCAKKIPPTPLHHHHQPEPLRQGRMIHAFMFFTPNSDPTSECCSRNQDSSDQATFLQSSIVQFWWVCVNCILRVLFLSDRSGTRCGLLLLESICFRVRCVVCSEMVFCRSWL